MIATRFGFAFARAIAGALVVASAFGVFGCRAANGPNLLTLTGTSQSELELGDRLAIVGNNLPEGRTARVIFRGDLHRPGQKIERNIEISVPAGASSARAVELVINEELERKFCTSEDPAHTTFRGEVAVSFAPRSSHAPPVMGSIEGVVIDVNPSRATRTAHEARIDEGRRFTAFVGLTVRALTDAGPFVVDTLDPNGRALRAGIEVGDTLLELDGLNVRSEADLLPPPRTRLSRVVVRRANAKDPVTIALDVSGFRPGSPAELVPAAMLLAAVFGLMLLFFSPLGRKLAWIGQRIGATLRTRGRVSAGERARERQRLVSGVLGAISRELPVSPLPYVAFIAASAAFTALALGKPLVARELDLPILVLSAMTMLLSASFAAGGVARTRRWSLMTGLMRMLTVLGYQLPILAALACVVMLAGSLRADDIVAAQGGEPWRFYVFDSPIALGAFLLFVACLVPEGSRVQSALENYADSAPRSRTGRLLLLAEWAYLVLMCGVATLAFLGGYRLPFVTAADQTALLRLQVLGAIVFQFKVSVLVATIAFVRWALCHVHVEQVRRIWFAYCLPLSAVCVVASGLWISLVRTQVFSSAREALGPALFFSCVLACLYVARRASLELRGSSGHSASVNPWL